MSHRPGPRCRGHRRVRANGDRLPADPGRRLRPVWPWCAASAGEDRHRPRPDRDRPLLRGLPTTGRSTDPPLAGESAWTVRPRGQRDGRHRPRGQIPFRGAAPCRLRGSSSAHPPAGHRGQPRAPLHSVRAASRRDARVGPARAVAAERLAPKQQSGDRTESGVVRELRAERQRTDARERVSGDAEIEGGDRQSGERSAACGANAGAVERDRPAE